MDHDLIANLFLFVLALVPPVWLILTYWRTRYTPVQYVLYCICVGLVKFQWRAALPSRFPLPRNRGAVLIAKTNDSIALGQALGSHTSSLVLPWGSETERMRSTLLSSVSHDLRTPLTAIRGYAEAITDGTAPNVGQAAAVISREARRLERLVADLLDLARLDARAFSLVIGAVDLVAAARAVIAAADPVTVRLGLEVTLSAPDAPVWVMADPERLEQVIANLLENAQRYALATISVSVRAPGSGSGSGTMAELRVEDDGPGIASEDRPHVFERLYVSSHRPSRNESGSGLGLAIVHQLVSAMGGEVRADSGDTSAGDEREAAGAGGAGGACLAFTLPYAPAR
jgi:signal transduction histidine kinase